ncbi:MAG: 1-deoxy-D-xylulose-5-phosphate reductoisomerase [Elusimicrobiota bacterium]
MKTIAVLGSTGSIGTMTLDVITKLKNYKVIALSAYKNIPLLKKQIQRFRPKEIVIFDSEAKDKFIKNEKALIKKFNLRVHTGVDGLNRIASLKGLDIVLVAVVGAIGLEPIFSAIRNKITVALANKEPLVIAGSLIMKEAEKYQTRILPVDSEHSAIFQCLLGENPNNIKRILLTASGGPFYKFTEKQLKSINVKDSLKHPRWKMGPKITIDSATLMNKGLEVIEAHHLFGVPLNKISVVIHPQSIIHSMVEFIDDSIKAQMSATDMRGPIQNALTFPNREKSSIPSLDLTKIGCFTFDKPDTKMFPCLALAINAQKIGGTMPAVLNAANEIAVAKFLKGEIGFLDIPKIIKKTMSKHIPKKLRAIKDVLIADEWARKTALGVLK